MLLMRNIYVICLMIFLIAWGIGVTVSYIIGLSKSAGYHAPLNPQPAYLEEEKTIASESEKKRKKSSQDAQYQIQTYKNLNHREDTGRF